MDVIAIKVVSYNKKVFIDMAQSEDGILHLQLPTGFNWEGNVTDKWKIFKQQFQIYVTASGISSSKNSGKRLCALLLHALGPESLPVYNSFKFQKKEVDNFESLIEKFDQYFLPKKNVVFEQHMFFTRNQSAEENIEKYVAELRNLAQSCEFGQMEDMLIRGRVICGLKDDKLREKLLKEGDITLQRVIDICKLHENTVVQMKNFENLACVDALKNYNKKNSFIARKEKTTSNCRYCGLTHLANKCPAFDSLNRTLVRKLVNKN
uniref:Retrotransposon gag domain-containing protein n=1 Tax=Rhodnius prolixus TaxID=13249 RepID=T1I2W9_RHOPR